jgi:hypothetical protein
MIAMKCGFLPNPLRMQTIHDFFAGRAMTARRLHDERFA